MSLGKVVENVVIFGGIGTMAYLLLKKPTAPKLSANTIAENSKIKCNNDLILLNNQEANLAFYDSQLGAGNREVLQKMQKEFDIAKANYYASDCAKKDPIANPNYDEYIYDHNRKPTGTLSKACEDSYQGIMYPIDTKEQMVKRCRELSYRRYGKNEITEDLVTDSVLLIPKSEYNFYSSNGDILANSCVDLDTQLKKIEKILTVTGGDTASMFRQIKADTEAKFKKFNCRDKIEAQRTKDLISLESQGSIKAEESIGKSSAKNQNAYIILGSLVLLTGFYIVIKK
jgi:hypothetical protein